MNEKLNNSLLKRLPKKYHNRFVKICMEDDLIDNCNYMLYYSEYFTDGDCKGGSMPVKSINEAIYILKYCLFPINQ